MTGRQFIARVREVGRARGVEVRIDTMKGKGSHVLLLYGDDRRTIVKDRRKELGAGLLSAMIRQLGLQRSDFESKPPSPENAMRFVYPARLHRTGPDEVVVSFRDLPECLTSGADEAEALAEAADALDVAIAGRIVHPPAEGDPIPMPSVRLTAEHDVAVPADTAAKAALVLALRDSGLSRSGLARRLGVDVKVVRRMLDPRHRTAASRIGAALHELGRELVVETRVPQPVR
ncbi:MAG: type II toxin-antitoxin system HicA family toxin [Spirochaetaceae bacterium]|nr:type II toxin-antitoxin system HicA family toxin [Spirochaetaceae bacterium]